MCNTMHTQHEECIFFFQLDGNIGIQSLEHCHIKSTWKQIKFEAKSNLKNHHTWIRNPLSSC